MQKKEKIVYIICVLILILTSVFSLGYHHFDEHFQILEFAASKLNLTTVNDLPWEYHSQIRATIQPVIAVGLYKFFDFFGVNSPFTIALSLRLLSASFAFLSMWLMYTLYRKKISNKVLSNWFLILSFLLWFVIYNGVRFSSENWSGMFFVMAFALYFLIKKQKFIFFISIGVILGLSFLFRYQSGLFIAGFLFWIFFIQKQKLLNLFWLLLGISLVVFLGIIIDQWFYGEMTITAWNYFEQAFILKNSKASVFEASPWWWYIKAFFVRGIPPFSLLFIMSIIILFVFKRKSPITWSILPFLVAHFIIGHKEIRFLFPIFYFLPIILIEAFELIQVRYKKSFFFTKIFKVFMTVFFIVHFVFLIIVVFKPADNHISLYKTIYKDYTNPTTLYYFSENPYQRVLDIHFYKRENLRIKKINSIEEIKSKSNTTDLLVFTNRENIVDVKGKKKLVYSSFPEWVQDFNYGNWLERTRIWYVYEL